MLPLLSHSFHSLYKYRHEAIYESIQKGYLCELIAGVHPEDGRTESNCADASEKMIK